METKELDNPCKEEFLEIKGQCKSRVKRDVYTGLICVIILILLLFDGLRVDGPKNMLSTMIMIAIVCSVVWMTVLSFRYLKKVDNLDTPDQLLYWFEKKHRYDLISWLVNCLLFTGLFLAKPGSNLWIYVGVAVGIVIVALFCYSGGSLWYRKEKDTIEQLRELAEKK